MPLRRSFSWAYAASALVSAAKPTRKGSLRLGRQRRDDVGVFGEFEPQRRAVGFLQFVGPPLPAGGSRRPRPRRCRCPRRMPPRAPPRASAGRCAHRYGVRRAAWAGNGARHQDNRRPGIARGGGNGKTHATGTAIADKAHRIDVLVGRPRADHHRAPAKRLLAERGHQDVAQLVRFKHPPGADIAAGLVAIRRSEHAHATHAQRAHVRLHGQVGPHLLVHRRGDIDRRRRGEDHGGKEVVGETVRKPCQGVGAGRRDQYAFGPAGQFDMAHGGFALLVPQAHPHGLPRQRLEGGGRDEMRGAFGHHHAHFRLEVAQPAHELADLVGGDAPGDANQDATLAKSHDETTLFGRHVSLTDFRHTTGARFFRIVLSSCLGRNSML